MLDNLEDYIRDLRLYRKTITNHKEEVNSQIYKEFKDYIQKAMKRCQEHLRQFKEKYGSESSSDSATDEEATVEVINLKNNTDKIKNFFQLKKKFEAEKQRKEFEEDYKSEEDYDEEESDNKINIPKKIEFITPNGNETNKPLNNIKNCVKNMSGSTLEVREKRYLPSDILQKYSNSDVIYFFLPKLRDQIKVSINFLDTFCLGFIRQYDWLKNSVPGQKFIIYLINLTNLTSEISKNKKKIFYREIREMIFTVCIEKIEKPVLFFSDVLNRYV